MTSIFHVTYLCCVESLSIHNLLSEESAPPCSSTMTVAMCLALIINPLIINQHSLLTSVTPAVCRDGYLSHSVIMWLQKQQAISMPLSLKHFVLLATDYFYNIYGSAASLQDIMSCKITVSLCWRISSGAVSFPWLLCGSECFELLNLHPALVWGRFIISLMMLMWILGGWGQLASAFL